VELFDITSQKWSMAVPMNKRRAHHSIIKLTDGSIIAIGGFSERTCEILNKDYTQWTFTDTLNTRMHWSQTVVLMKDGNLLSIGGYLDTSNDTIGALRECEIYDYLMHNWELTAPLNIGRFEHTATVLNDGRVLVVGGRTKYNGYILLNTCEIFDPITKKWAYSAPMHHPRAGHSATLLSSGKVLVIGGQQNKSELYDPLTNSWERVGEISFATGINKAVTLAREKYLLLIGGKVHNGWELYSLEKFESLYYEKFSRIIWNQVILKIDDNRVLIAGGEEAILSVGVPVLTSSNLCQIYDINLTGIREDNEYNNLPNVFSLSCYPNPFNSSTNITVELSSPKHILLKVYNTLGEEVDVIYKGELNIGTHTFRYRMNNHSSGVYFVRMHSSKEAKLIKIIYQK
jgi:hypothetical protein